MIGPQTIWVNYYNITLYKGLWGRGLNKFSSPHRRILVNGFGEARSEARKAKVGGPKGVRFLGGAASPLPTS